MESKEKLLKRVKALRSPKRKADLYAEFLWEYMLHSPAEAAEISETALEMARKGGFESGVQQLLFIRGYCRLFMAYYDQAEEDFLEVLRYHRRQEDDLGEIRVLNALGVLSEGRGLPRTALIYFHSCLIKSREARYPEREYAAAANAGAVYAGMGVPEKALELLLPLRDLPEDEDFGEHRTVNYANVGKAYLHMGEWEKAESCFSRELDLCRERQDRLHELWTLISLAKVKRSRAQPDEAGAYLQEAEALVRPLGDRKTQVILPLEKGRLLEVRGETEEAMNTYRKALALAEEFGTADVERDICRRISQIAAAGGDYQRAFRLERQAGEIDRRLRDEDIRGQTENWAETPGEGFYQAEQDIAARIHSLPRPRFPQVSVIRHIGYRIASCLDMEKILSMVYENVNQLLDAAVLGIAL